MEEVWKDIEGYEGYYQVSSIGRVRSVDRYVNHGGKSGKGLSLKNGRILKPTLSGKGYPSVMLSKNSKPKRMLVHRLVAEAFIPNPYNYDEINHKSEVKTENFVENLEWCDRKYNNNYGNRCEKYIKTRTEKKC